MNAGATSLADRMQQAVAHHQRGDLSRAQAIYDRILKQQPGHFDALHLSGVIAAQRNRPEQALRLIGKAIQVNPRSAEAFCNQGSAYRLLSRFEDARQSYDRAIALRPDYTEAHYCRGVVLRELGHWAEALASCERALALQPGYAAAHCGRGKVFRELQQWEQARACFQQALALEPDYVEAHNDYGLVVRELEGPEAALACYERALAIDSGYAHAHLNRANALLELHRLDEARAAFDRAIELQPEFAEARANRATLLLLQGDLGRGFPDYEWRWKVRRGPLQPATASFRQPLWTGAMPVAGRTLLLHAEMGLGDTLQFCRYAPLVAALGARVILQVPDSLVAVMSTLQGVAAVHGESAALPPYDQHCRIMSLPAAFRTTLATIPAQVPYLRSDPARVRAWRERLGPRHRPRVGLVWSGRVRPREQEGWSVLSHRIVPLEKLAGLGTLDIEFHSLQKGEPAESDLAALAARGWGGPQLVDHTALLVDFAETAALIDNLDLVITVDTSTAHLAAAMGREVWILLCFDCCWRWQMERADSPWYPTARLYRQPRPGDWDDVISRVRRDLGARTWPA